MRFDDPDYETECPECAATDPDECPCRDCTECGAHEDDCTCNRDLLTGSLADALPE